MNEVIKVFEEKSFEHHVLRSLADILKGKSPNGYEYYVGKCYFDYGQGWLWTTVLCDDEKGWGGYQALSPREQFEALNGRDLYELADAVLSDEYCPDKAV